MHKTFLLCVIATRCTLFLQIVWLCPPRPAQELACSYYYVFMRVGLENTKCMYAGSTAQVLADRLKPFVSRAFVRWTCEQDMRDWLNSHLTWWTYNIRCVLPFCSKWFYCKQANPKLIAQFPVTWFGYKVPVGLELSAMLMLQECLREGSILDG